ncbi:MAG: HAMP domain-containing histidine kinase [Deltaproteobacteria bacterium]|nr:HAMP domain-containing histidine kinase [Deltaproteobacteria bacterium]
MKPVNIYITGILRLSLFILLLILSLAIIFITMQNVKIVRNLAVDSLKNTADGLKLSAENALRSTGEDDSSEIGKVFSDRIVAYAFIAEKDGNILFHTNRALKNTEIFSSQEMEKRISAGTDTGRRITLGTGMPAYEFNYIIDRENTPELLRLVLQTTESDKMIQQAERMWLITGLLIILLWTAGIIFERFYTHRIKTQVERENQKRLTLIGQMTSVLAHEIRNALGSIKGYAQWLEEKAEKGSPQKEALAMVVKGSLRIEALVRELMLYSKEEDYHEEKMELAPLIEEVIVFSTPDSPQKIELNITTGTYVKADREKLFRVIVNGVRNAMDAVKETGLVVISAIERGGWVEISIEDTGEGLSEKDTDRIFTPFYTTKTDGTGLGLAYSKKVIEGMGGSIKLTNRTDGTGAALTIRLPSARSK